MKLKHYSFIHAVFTIIAPIIDIHLPNITLTYFCGWDGSSPRETVSPGMSLKHFWQKLYLSENKAGVGFLKNIDNIQIESIEILTGHLICKYRICKSLSGYSPVFINIIFSISGYCAYSILLPVTAQCLRTIRVFSTTAIA